jgi:hypothetical protein
MAVYEFTYCQRKSFFGNAFYMGGGYVLDFFDATIATFMGHEVGVDIHHNKYCSNGVSKAKKMREFWRIESDHLVGRALNALIKKAEDNAILSYGFPYKKEIDKEKANLIDACKTIATRFLSGQVNLDHLKQTAHDFDARHLAEQIRRMEQSVHQDPALAIGTAKELIETCCKTILAERGMPVAGTPDMPTLTKATLKELGLVPEGIPEKSRGNDIVKRLLQNLGTIGNGLAELRGLYGTGHGKEGRVGGLTTRRAKLAVGAAATLATFLFDTHEETKDRTAPKDVA